MKKRNVFAGALVGALALGLWLGSFWKGPGLGGLGTGFGIGNGEGETQPVSLDSVQVNAVSDRSVSPRPVPEEKPPEYPTDMMTVVIYGNEYRLLNGDLPQSGEQLTLNEIGDRAKKMTGTPEGIRVRILKGKSAQEGARADLLKYLSENGVKREEIQERAEFVD